MSTGRWRRAWDYDSLKDILADRKYPGHNEMKEWSGGGPKEKWEAEAFDPEKTKKSVSWV